jgi:folate-binding protein YgfZ
MNVFWQHLNTAHPDSRIHSNRYWTSGNNHRDEDSSLRITALSQYGLIAIDGPDTHKFLQGQTTCDWRKIDTEHAARGSYCNIKGRMVISFLAGMISSETALLRCHSDTTASGRDTLAKYIVFSKAKIRDASEEFVALGLSGSLARQHIITAFGAAPEGLMAQTSDGQSVIVQLDDAGERFEYWGPAEAALNFWQAISTDANISDSQYWEQLNIAEGIGEVCASTQDVFIPQMLNYQLIGGVSFNKGCYTGQEVVARMQYRGKLKRRLYRAKLAGKAFNHLPGSELFSDGAQSIGNLVMAAQGEEHCELLAVLTEDAVSNGQIHFAEESSFLQILELPYSIPTKD